jgi:hypothetical protein
LTLPDFLRFFASDVDTDVDKKKRRRGAGRNSRIHGFQTKARFARRSLKKLMKEKNSDQTRLLQNFPGIFWNRKKEVDEAGGI